MSNARTPLLAGSQELPPPTRYLVRDHVRSPRKLSYVHLKLTIAEPVFLRACHSPWTFIPQTTLIWARGIIVAYLTALAPALLNLSTSREHPWSTAFDFSVLSYSLLWLYHAIVFVSQSTPVRLIYLSLTSEF